MSHKKIEHSGNFYRQTVSLTSRALLFYFSHSLEIFLYLNTVWFTIRLVLLHDAWRVRHDMAWIEIGVGFGRVVLFCSVLYLSRGMYCVIIPFVRHCLNTFVLFFLCLFVGVCHCLLNVHMCVADTTAGTPEPHVERSKSARFPRDGEFYLSLRWNSFLFYIH